MFGIRDWLEILRGSAHPLQIVLACLMGALLAFVPDPWGGGLGLTLFHFGLLLILNASLPLALFAWAPLKLLAMAAMPLSFDLGRWLVDGPGHEAIKWAANAPGLALLGLERYATVGGLLLAIPSGLIVGWLVQRAIGAFRRKMAKLEEESQRYGKVKEKVEHSWWMKLLIFALAGGKGGQDSYKELVEASKERPVRVSGLIVVALGAATIVFVPGLLGGPLLAPMVRDGLADWNGATVDLGGLSLDLTGGKLVLTDLAVADPEALSTDVFRAGRIEADVAVDDILRKRLSLDRVVVIDGESGATRAVPGERLGGPPKARQPPAKKPGAKKDEKTVDDYLEKYDSLKERAARVREWLEKLSPSEEEGAAQPDDATLEEELQRMIDELGYARVVARGLVDRSPTVLVRELLAEGVKTTWHPGDPLDVRAANLSSDPKLVAEAPTITVRSRSGDLLLDLGLGGTSAAGGGDALVFHLRGLDTALLADVLPKSKGRPLLREGSLDLALDGGWGDGKVGELDLPLDVTLHDVTLDLLGKEQTVDGVVLPFGLRGPLDNPRISFDDDALTSALQDAAEDAAKQRAKDELQGALKDKLGVDAADADDLKAQLGNKLGDKLDKKDGKSTGDALKDKASSALGKLLGGDDGKSDKDKKKPKKKDDDGGGL
ncbi:MAG: hypothetical protein H6825_09625 [Planctomycetes bacterium]|nr:hypothetical protein [Planctomycetota bacterium]